MEAKELSSVEKVKHVSFEIIDIFPSETGNIKDTIIKVKVNITSSNIESDKMYDLKVYDIIGVAVKLTVNEDTVIKIGKDR